MAEMSIAGDGAEWSVFTRRTQDGAPVVVRSRLKRDLLEVASANLVARLRCVPHDDQINSGGMPINTDMLDEYEDALIAQLERNKAFAFEIAVVTGDGCRDLFFAIATREDLRDAIEQIRADRPFKLKIGWIEGPKDGLLASLCP